VGTNLRAALSLLPRSRPADLPGAAPEHSVTVDRAHLAEYDRVCGFPLTDTLPATYPHVLAFPAAMRLMSAADFPFPVVGLVHVANRIEQHRPLTAGEPLRIRVHAENLRAHERGRQFDIVAEAVVDGRAAWRGVSTYLRRAKATTGGGPRDRAEPPAASAVWRVGARVGADYAAVSGDHNPIHTSRLGARLFGFPRPIAHGMWTAARCLAALDARLPGAFAVDVAFKLPVPLPATVGFGTDGSAFRVDGRGPHLAGRVTSI